MKLVDTPSTKLGAEGGKWLKSLIDASIAKDRDYFNFMQDYRSLLAGKHWEVLKKKSRDQVKMVINLAHAHVRTLVPTIFFQNPTVDCIPTSPLHAGKEVTWNGVLNNTLDKTAFSEVAKKVIMDAVLYPEGVMKSVVIKPVNDKLNESSEASTGGPAVWLTKGAPSHVRIAPSQLIVDYLSKSRDLENARFIAIRYRKPFHELKAHPIYGKNIERENTASFDQTPTIGNAVKYTGKESLSDWDEDADRNPHVQEELVTIYEVWVHQLISPDGKNYKLYQQMCVLLEGQDKPIRELTPWEEVMGEGYNQYPVTRIVLNEIPDMTPASELGVWSSMQIAVNWLMSRITNLVENDRQIYAVDPTKIKNMQKFRTQFYHGEPRVLAEVTEPNAVELIQPSFVGRDNYSLVNLLLQFIQQVSGIGQNRRGGSGIRTATEASIVDRGVEIKTDEKVDIVAKFLKAVISKMTVSIRSLVKNRPDGTRWVFYVGGDVGAVNWIDFTAEDIEWIPDVVIRVNSFRKNDSMQEMQKLSGLLGTSMQMASLYGPGIRSDILFSRMLQAAGVHDAHKIVTNQDQDFILQTIELAGLISGTPTPVLEDHNHMIHKQVIQMFKQSPYGQALMQAAPQIADRLAMHEQEHDQLLMEQQQKAQNAQITQQNPFMAAGLGGEGNAQSQANQLTAQDRTQTQTMPGGTGEFM